MSSGDNFDSYFGAGPSEDGFDRLLPLAEPLWVVVTREYVLPIAALLGMWYWLAFHVIVPFLRADMTVGRAAGEEHGGGAAPQQQRREAALTEDGAIEEDALRVDDERPVGDGVTNSAHSR